MTPSHSYQHGITTQQGFTLLEVLIAVLVLAFGLMGLAGIQATGIKNNNSAYYRSVAAQYAAEMADRMRANATIDYSTKSAAPHAACKTTTGCTPSEMAEHDFNEWINALQSALPSGTGTVTAKVGAGSDPVFVVTVSWDDTRSGAANTSFAMDVRP